MSDDTYHRADDLRNPSVELRSTIIGLCFACPFDQGNPEGCLFHEIRERPMSERFAWVMHLDEGTMQAYCDKHQRCLATKEAKPASPPAESNSPVFGCCAWVPASSRSPHADKISVKS